MYLRVDADNDGGIQIWRYSNTDVSVIYVLYYQAKPYTTTIMRTIRYFMEFIMYILCFIGMVLVSACLTIYSVSSGMSYFKSLLIVCLLFYAAEK